MLIRSDQLATFSSASQYNFALSLVHFLKQHYPDAAKVSDPDLLPPVQRLIARAQPYGLKTEQDIAIYVIAGFLLGETFDIDFPAVQQILPSPMLSAAEKAAWLTRWTEELFKTLQKE